MPRNLDDFVYVPVPIRKNSQLYRHLKEEAARKAGDKGGNKKQIPLGPHIADVLDDRDRAIYGEEGAHELYYSTSTPHLTALIEAAVQKVIASLPLGTSMPTQPIEVIQVSSEEEMDEEAARLASSWLSDDDE